MSLHHSTPLPPTGDRTPPLLINHQCAEEQLMMSLILPQNTVGYMDVCMYMYVSVLKYYIQCISPHVYVHVHVQGIDIVHCMCMVHYMYEPQICTSIHTGPSHPKCWSGTEGLTEQEQIKIAHMMVSLPLHSPIHTMYMATCMYVWTCSVYSLHSFSMSKQHGRRYM